MKLLPVDVLLIFFVLSFLVCRTCSLKMPLERSQVFHQLQLNTFSQCQFPRPDASASYGRDCHRNRCHFAGFYQPSIRHFATGPEGGLFRSTLSLANPIGIAFLLPSWSGSPSEMRTSSQHSRHPPTSQFLRKSSIAYPQPRSMESLHFSGSPGKHARPSSFLHAFEEDKLACASGDVAAIKDIRTQFPALSQEAYSKSLVYFDNAATSMKPLPVLYAVNDFYRTYNSNVHRAAHSLASKATEEYESARELLASFINAKNNREIVFVRSATEAINLVAYTWGEVNIKEGDEILLTVAEHHSNLVPWQELAKRKKASIAYIPLSHATGELDYEKIRPSSKTRLLAIQQTSNVLGNVVDIPRIARIVQQEQEEGNARGDLKILVDACQSLPHQKVDVQSLNCDFLVGSGHKMFGPTGVGFLYARSDLLSNMPPWQYGGEMIEHVTFEGSTYRDGPSRFEAGTPAIAQVIGLGACVQFLQNIGWDVISKQEKSLAAHLLAGLKQVAPDMQVHGAKDWRKRSSLVSLSHPKLHANDIATFLDFEGIAVRAGHHCCQPLHEEVLEVKSTLRASLCFYNTHEEIDRFLSALSDTIKLLSDMQEKRAGVS